MKRRTWCLVGGLALAAAVAVVALVAGRRAGTFGGADTVSAPAVSQTAGEARKAASRPAGPEKAARARPPKPELDLDDDDDGRTPEEKALAERIEKALDDEKLADAVACAKEALNCKNAEIRQAMVDTLGWFGEKALPELTPFLADPDEDVRDSAMSEWSMAISEIENEAEKIGIVEVAMNILSDEDALEDISGEYIGIDEKIAVESLVRIVEANGSKNGVAKAKETYEFVTGEEWTSAADAAKWIAEEYEPPEPDGE